MPIFDILCPGCGYRGEVLALSPGEPLTCPSCGGAQPEKQMSPTSTLSGSTRRPIPGPRDHGCCGSRPAEAGCAGPGSCCAGGHGRK
jgi:putative FmdB family regulatory protein